MLPSWGMTASARGRRPRSLAMVARGAALGAVREIDVLKEGEAPSAHDLLAQFVREETTLLKGGEDGLAPLAELAELGQSVANGLDSDLVKAPGGLFAVARDEWDGRVVVKEGDSRVDLRPREAKLSRYLWRVCIQ